MEADAKERVANVYLLKKCDLSKSAEVVHKLVDGVCHRAWPSYEDYSSVWDLQEWWAMSDAVIDLIKGAAREAFNKDQLFAALEGMDDTYRSQIYDILVSRQEEVKHQLLADSHSISQATLADFDWKLKLLMSSDKISSVQEPVVSVDLDLSSSSSQAPPSVSLELNKDELNTLIASLETANKALVQLKS